MQATSMRVASTVRWQEELAGRAVAVVLRPLQAIMALPSLLFLAALVAMLFRHPDVSFYEVDRVAFGLLVLAVVGKRVVLGQRLLRIERSTWPMLGLTVLAVGSVAGQPFDNQTWCLIAAKFIVPFTLFHLAGMVFTEERFIRHFETFALLVLAYLSFTAVAFLVGAKQLIFPHFILDASLGYHADRARGPLLQAVANGVSLNLLGLLAWHSFRRGRVRGVKAALLLGSVPVAILATMTRAVWLSFGATIFFLMLRSRKANLRRAYLGLAITAAAGFLIVVSIPQLQTTLTQRMEERGPVDFREAVYAGGWQMFLERPLTGWGVNQMPSELARHVSGYKETALYPHNTYLELLVEHGITGLALYGWLMWEIWRLGRAAIPRGETGVFLDGHFHRLWPLLLGVYWINAGLVVMNYQFVNGLLFTMAGMLAAQQRKAEESAVAWDLRPATPIF
jgi:putative inorganic carbon (HCO3(-)) transporter